MPYIGNEVGNRFVASKAASVYSGNGSTTAFTLEHAVGSDEDILVSVDGVVQEPSVAYAVSSGTTLTFTAAPSSNSGNNIFVYYLFRTVATVDHPATSALSATNGTFTGDVTIGDASAADKKILFDGNAQDFHIGLDDSTDSLTIGKGSALGTTTSMAFDANGIITKPLQPAFLARASTTQSNLASNDVVAFGTEVFDQNSDFASNTFTAPVTGKYFLSATLRLDAIDTAASYYIPAISTSNMNYNNIINPKFTADPSYYSMTITVVADMDANDVAYVNIIQAGGTAQTDVSIGDDYTYFTGYLLG